MAHPVFRQAVFGVVSLISAASSALSEEWGQPQLIEPPARTINANFFGAVTTLAGSKFYWPDYSSKTIVLYERDKDRWSATKTIPIPYSLRGMAMAPGANFAVWAGGTFANGSGDALVLTNPENDFQVEDQAIQEWGTASTAFGYRFALSKNQIVTTSNAAGDLPDQIHLFERASPGRWVRRQVIRPGFDLSNVFIGRFENVVYLIHHNKISLYMATSAGIDLKQVVDLPGYEFGWAKGAMSSEFLAIPGRQLPNNDSGLLILRRSGDSWALEKFLNPNEKDRRAAINSVVIQGSEILFGVDCQLGSSGEACEGAAYLARRTNDGEWNVQHVFHSPNAGPNLHFGISVNFYQPNEVLIGSISKTKDDAEKRLNIGAVFVFRKKDVSLGNVSGKNDQLSFETEAPVSGQNVPIPKESLALSPPIPVVPSGTSRTWRYGVRDFPVFWLKWEAVTGADSYTLQIMEPKKDVSACGGIGRLGGTITSKPVWLPANKFCSMGYCYYQIGLLPHFSCQKVAYHHKWQVKARSSAGESDFSAPLEFWAQ